MPSPSTSPGTPNRGRSQPRARCQPSPWTPPPSAKSCPELGKTFLDGLRQHAADNNVKLEGLPDDPNVDIPPEQIITVLRSALALYFPLLAPP